MKLIEAKQGLSILDFWKEGKEFRNERDSYQTRFSSARQGRRNGLKNGWGIICPTVGLDWAYEFPDRTGPDAQICQTGPAGSD